MTQMNESAPRCDEVQLRVRHQRERSVADEAFEIWKAAMEVAAERYDTLERVDRAAISAEAYRDALRAWLDARKLSSGLMVRFASLEATATHSYADWVQVRDLPTP